MKKKIESYQGAAGGWGAVKSVANAVRKQMDIRQDVIAMFDMNKPEGFDCPGCAWPDHIIQIELRDDQDAALKNGDSKTVIVDEITRNAQFPLKARAITVNGNASQGTIEALINVIYTWQ